MFKQIFIRYEKSCEKFWFFYKNVVYLQLKNDFTLKSENGQ
nr:MAG TPA: hypothetical protein [Caudoviricetes sp.]